jgi:Raf kinase inhibitor-like YbhB/YbcL family protein
LNARPLIVDREDYRGLVHMLAAVLACVALTACGGSDDEVETQAPEVIEVTSTAFAPDDPIPDIYTCNGSNISPPLAWTGVPEGARELALVVDDPDAPRGTYTHWILFGLPPSTDSLAEGSVPPNAKQAQNSNGKAAYMGPCPPSGTHHYRFTVYAFEEPLDLADGAGTDEALTTISRAAIAQGRLVGTFAGG